MIGTNPKVKSDVRLTYFVKPRIVIRKLLYFTFTGIPWKISKVYFRINVILLKKILYLCLIPKYNSNIYAVKVKLISFGIKQLTKLMLFSII